MSRAVGYVRVSSDQQMDNWSIQAQTREFELFCRQKGWTPLRVYSEEGVSARSDSIDKRPRLKQLLADCAAGAFDVVVVHSLDRWSRNLRVTLETFKFLADHRIAFASITENIDYSTPEGRLFIAMLGAFAQYYSDSLSKHASKGMRERAQQGFHTGGVPFGYRNCKCHDARIHSPPAEAASVLELFKRYASGSATLAELAAWLNEQGFRTRNQKRLKDGHGNEVRGPRLFTTHSVRWLLHNPFFCGKVAYRGEFIPGRHEPIVSEALFEAVKRQLHKNSGRSRTTWREAPRVYLLKGIVKCVHCGMPLWAETLKNGRQYYREQRGSRGYGDCPARGKSIPAAVVEDQVCRIVEALGLEESWKDYILAQVTAVDERERVLTERRYVEERLKRLGRAFVDGLVAADDYDRQQRELKARIETLVIPEMEASIEAGALIENLGVLWRHANVEERHRILLAMLDAVYVDMVEARKVVALAPKPAFSRLFEVVTTAPGSGVTILKEPLSSGEEPGDRWLWWRRGRVELPVHEKIVPNLLQA